MKVGILTASRTNNNGTDLQAYAMQLLFSSLGYEAEVIDYRCNKLDSSHNVFRLSRATDLIRIPWKVFMQISHEKFRKTFLVKSQEIFSDHFILDGYDAVVVGSDQVWNLDITGQDLNFWLPASAGVFKRMSYAASIGKLDVRDWEAKYQLSQYLKAFDGVSVREQSAVDALAAIGVEAREDLDPIIAVGKDALLSVKGGNTPRKKYVLLYLVQDCQDAINDAIKYSNDNSCNVIMVSNISKPIRHIKTKHYVSLPQWITLMDGADCIFTNSYHGISTAITLNKNIRVYPLKSSDGNARALSLLAKTRMMECYSTNQTDVFLPSIEKWKEVNSRLDDLRIRSCSYINTILRG